jgi:hypothetical protein
MGTRSSHPNAPDAKIQNLIVEVKFGVDATRTLRTALLHLAEMIADDSKLSGLLVLADSVVTAGRLQKEWSRAVRLLRPELMKRMIICIASNGRFHGVPSDPDPDVQAALRNIVDRKRGAGKARLTRTDYAFVIRKLLLRNRLLETEPMRIERLARLAGCTYPTAARVLKQLGGLVTRTSDRRAAIRYVPREFLAYLAANSERARTAVRFADASGQPRSSEALVRALERLQPAGVAIGGTLGAAHYFRQLDLVGTPRLDLSVHAPDGHADLAFVRALDPALKMLDDPLQPATLVVHAVRHADSLFEKRAGGLAWADPIDCYFDLQEAKLETQARQFMAWLEHAAKERESA